MYSPPSRISLLIRFRGSVGETEAGTNNDVANCWVSIDSEDALSSTVSNTFCLKVVVVVETRKLVWSSICSSNAKAFAGNFNWKRRRICPCASN